MSNDGIKLVRVPRMKPEGFRRQDAKAGLTKVERAKYMACLLALHYRHNTRMTREQVDAALRHHYPEAFDHAG